MNRIPKSESLMKSTKINKRIAPGNVSSIILVSRGCSFIFFSSVLFGKLFLYQEVESKDELLQNERKRN